MSQEARARSASGGRVMSPIEERRAQSELGQQLEQVRLSRGWSLRRAERESGVSNSYISQIEHGAVEASPDVLRRIAHAYGVPFDLLMETAGYIMKRTEPKEGSNVPAFVFSAAERFDKDDWEIAQAFFQALLTRKEKNGPTS